MTYAPAHKKGKVLKFLPGGVLNAPSPFSYHAGGLRSHAARLGDVLPTSPWAWWVVGMEELLLTVVPKAVGWKWEKLPR